MMLKLLAIVVLLLATGGGAWLFLKVADAMAAAAEAAAGPRSISDQRSVKNNGSFGSVNGMKDRPSVEGLTCASKSAAREEKSKPRELSSFVCGHGTGRHLANRRNS